MLHTTNPRRFAGSPFRRFLPLLVLAAAGCSELDLGPEPDNAVVPGRYTPQPLTDTSLQAVKPVVPGDATQPATTQAGAAALASNQPAAANDTATSGPQSLPGGRIQVPAQLSVQDAILVALQNNANLRVQRLSVPIRRTSEEQARAAFDPTVTGQVQGGANGSSSARTTNNVGGNIGVTQSIPTGATVSATYTTSNTFGYSDAPPAPDASSNSGVNLSITQSLLRGAGLDVNLASLRESRLDVKVTQYQLRGFAESLVEQIETTYWDLVFAERDLDIVKESLDVAQKQLQQTRTLITAGRGKDSDLPAAAAEVHSREQDLIDAEANVNTTRLRLLQLLTPPGQPFWDRAINLQSLPFIPQGAMDSVDKHVEVALRMRPEVNETRLQIQRGDLEIVRTKNGLLPRLDLFITLGKTGFATSFGESNTNLNGPDYQATFGVKGDWEPLNRSALASYHSAQLSRDQLDETMSNLLQTVELDVRTQYFDVERTRKQIDASAANLAAQQVKYDTEKALSDSGVAGHTSLTVALAQRDLVQAKVTNAQSQTNHLKSLVTLYRLEGSLLVRRGIDAPGAAPAPDLAWRR